MANRKADRGTYNCKVEFYDIYHKFSYEGKGKDRKVTGDQWDIYHAKKLLEGGLKTKELAVSKAQELFKEGRKKDRK